MKLVNVISNKTFKDSTGKERQSSYFAIEFDNGRRIPIKPIFDDYDILRFQCDKTIDLRKVNTNER